jgi:hypothetical protein
MSAARNAYWNLYTELKYQEYYYDHYLTRARNIDCSISIVCGVASLGCVLSWGIWQILPFLLSIIVVLAQVVQFARQYLPYTKQISGLTYFLPAYKKNVIKMGHDWLSIDDYPDGQICALFSQYETQCNDLESQYLNNIPMPHINRLKVKAEKNCSDFFSHRFNIGGEINGQERAHSTEFIEHSREV